ncbi:TonB-dependent receptor [Bacteroides sp. 51]|uniref:TonB-dependent receptor n=1 Tax=Bacteroides sp. 51 TaxID=2302938 RepID=UPI0013D8D1CE|nr:TonB-dependent receptor [Bacteroides sp. 51]NDV81900.1 SusC/RagA family TonB-linked outer membrane protein [Bacteroides sp. 51]
MDKICQKNLCYCKSSKIHKIIIPFLLVLMFVPVKLYAQQTNNVTLSTRNESLQQVLDHVEKTTIYRFTYRDAVLPTEKNITITANAMPIEGFLNRILASTTLTFRRNENSFAIVPKTQQKDRVVTGVVIDEIGEPLVGVTVLVKNSKTGTTTNIDGRFSITVDPTATLTFSYLGYLTTDVPIKGKSSIKVTMNPDSQTLDEVVVVGYGTMRKSDLTGSISSIKGSEMPKVANTTLAQSLKGAIPGLSFTQTSSQPGAAVWMQIRGAATDASPLIVVDGVPVSTMWEPSTGLNFGKGDKESVLDNINPDDIQDIQVLKDASATSIYGSRASGGVILITTKRGAEDAKRVDVTFKSSYTTQWIDEKPDVMKPKDYMRASNESQLERWLKDEGYYPWGEKQLPGSEEEIRRLYESAGQKWNYKWDFIDHFIGGTDWYDAITRNGEIQQYDLSVTGGNAKSSYLISLGHMSNDGIVKTNDYARTTGRINIDQRFNSWLKGGINASYSRINSNDVPISGAGGSTTLFQAARKYDPTIPIRDENGNYALGTIYGLSQNPVSLLDVSMHTKKDNILASAFLELNPIKDLAIKATVGYDRKFAKSGSYFPMTTQEGINSQGVARVNNSELDNYYFNITATYTKTFAKVHKLNAMVGWEYYEQQNEGLSAENRGFPYDGVEWHNLGLGTYERPVVGSSRYTGENASLISRINYSYKERYLITANFRRDGSSNFAANKQWGNFGGVALAWRLTQENFLKDVKWLHNLKLRAGYGVTGNAGSLTGINTYYVAGKDYYFNNKHTSGVALAALGNPNLSWESQEDINLGLDFGFFENKFGGSIDIYERTIKDRIGKKDLMSFHEINTINYNTLREDKTQGVDLMLYGTVALDNSFMWHTQFTLTYYKDFASKRDPSEILDINDKYRKRWDEMWYYETDGIIQPGETVNHMPGAIAGSVKIVDRDGYLYDGEGNIVRDKKGRPMYAGEPDGKIDKADLVLIGHNTPIPISWNNTFKYKNFDMNIYIYGKLNHWKNNDRKALVDYGTYQGINTITTFKDRFTYNNVNSTQPGFTQSTASQWGYGNYFMEKAWFFRIDNISVGYTLPKSITKNIFQSVRFNAAVKNVALISPYKGHDPEYDIYMYPSTSAFTFGIDFKF